MKFSKIILLIGSFLWLVLGFIIYYLHTIGNNLTTLIWASTSGILAICFLGLHLKKLEDEDVKC